MNIINRLVSRPRRILVHSYCSVLDQFPKQVHHISPIPSSLCVRTMAQTSIKSFFMSTPAKSIKQEKKVGEKSDPKDNRSPSNDKEKASAKRPRLESSDSDGSPVKKHVSSVTSSHKKVNRQRIESSDSESDTLSQSEQRIDKEDQNNDEKVAVKEEIDSPVKKKQNKIERTSSPKTYSSPKAKKPKVLSQINGNNSSKVKGSPTKQKVEEKSEVNKSPSPVKIKKEGETKNSKIEQKPAAKVKDEANGDNKGFVSETEYDPSKKKYHPTKDACWAAGAAVPYLALARTLELVERTSARLKIVDILANYFRSVIALTPEDLLPSIYMCLNQLAPAYHSLELGIAETYLMKAIGACTGRSVAQVKAAAAKCGDLGSVAEQARATQRTMFAPAPLTARKVFQALKEIAHMTGHASVNKKISKIQSLYVACRHSEAKYLIRSLEGKLRIGLAEQSVLQALALAAARTPPAGAQLLDAAEGLSPENFKTVVDGHALTIKTTYCECPNYEALVGVLLQHGVAALPQHCRLTPGVPLKPMLAHPTRGVSEVFDRFEKEQFTCEWKYDGERAQIHVPGDDRPLLENASIFSRNQENNTSKYPDILKRLPSLLKESVRSCVLDCEAVAYDTETKQILPFQVLSTRKRKDAVEADIKVQVCVFVFDLLYLNGTALVREPLRTRRDLLREHFREVEGAWQFATSKDCSGVEEVQQFLDEAVRGSCEGLMVKALDGDSARYDIARRSHNWLKLKKDYLEGVGDTLDLAVIGAYFGRGKRAGAFGGFLLACYEPHSEELQALCKVGTGFSDEDLAALSAGLRDHVIPAPRSYYRFDSAHGADAWVAARFVWEVRCADLSLSPAHRAAIGLVHPDKGISLRFPRFIRVREDKSPEQATTAQQIAEMYLAQDQVKNVSKNTKKASLDDFY